MSEETNKIIVVGCDVDITTTVKKLVEHSVADVQQLNNIIEADRGIEIKTKQFTEWVYSPDGISGKEKRRERRKQKRKNK